MLRSMSPARQPTVSRPLLSLSLDLDNQWSYMKTHGDAGWRTFPSYFDRLTDIVLDCLREHGLRITVFVVGQDAALEQNRAALRAFAEAGHEIGNHSFHHEPWQHLRTEKQIEAEIGRAEEQIAGVTGKRPRGFRGPGYSFSSSTLRVLGRRGYLYDASTFPTFLGPLARAFYFWKSRRFSAEEREQREKLFGTFRDGWRPVRPYFWSLGQGERILEIPVTTMPLLRLPMHQSYLVYLARYSQTVAQTYLRTASALCRATKLGPSFLLHPLDFLGKDRVPDLSFFPGMDLETSQKLALFAEVIGHFRRHYRLICMEEHAAAIVSNGEVPMRAVNLESAVKTAPGIGRGEP